VRNRVHTIHPRQRTPDVGRQYQQPALSKAVVRPFADRDPRGELDGHPVKESRRPNGVLTDGQQDLLRS